MRGVVGNERSGGKWGVRLRIEGVVGIWERDLE